MPVRILVYWYTHQKFYVRWGSSTSEAFGVSNGVRQGGVLSPYLFNVYVDGLSHILNKVKVSCRINNVSLNHLMYADDTVLISPSAGGLQHLLLLCEKFANTCDLIFNLRKTEYMCIKSKSVPMLKVPNVFLNGHCIKLVNEYKYLGVIMSDNCKDDLDINKQMRSLYARGNSLIKNFKKCSDEVKCQLFKTYCNSLYSCQLWCSFNLGSLNRIRVAYNRIFRILMGLKHRVSMSQIFLELGIQHFDIIIRKSIVGFIKRLELSDNVLIKTIVNSSFYMHSNMFKFWTYKAF